MAKKKRLNITDKQAIQEWDEFRKGLLDATTVDDTESNADKIKRIAGLEADPEKWFAYYFPNYVTSEPADFHKRATKRLLANKRWYEVRAWSRELAKSARSMFEVLYLALTGEIKNVLLISNSSDNAERLLMPFMLNLESNLRIINDYGDQVKLGSWEIGEFTALCGCSFRAIGAGQSPRGTRNEAFRPDFILVDDIDTDEECRNPARIENKWKWIEQALIPTVSVSGNYRILFNGNIIAKDCCIQRAIKKADKADIVNIRDKNSKSTWPGKNSEADIDRILSLISTASAQKEYFNNPVTEGSVFKEMRWGKVPPLNKFKFLINYSDPAPSNNTKSKANSFKANFLIGWLNGTLYVITGYLDHVTNAEFVEWFYYVDDYVKGKAIVYAFIENNKLQDPFYEQVFKPLFVEARKKHNKNVNISPDTRNKPDKFSRIEGNLEPLNREGRLILNETEKENPHMKRLEEQFLLVDPQLSAPADGPDDIEGGYWIANAKTQQAGVDDVYVPPRAGNNKRI